MAVDCHTVKFFSVDPKTINCMKCQPDLKLLALSRSDNTVEIWNVGWSPILERSFLGSGGSVACLAWFESRLFSVGLQGSIIEYDIIKLTAKSMYPLTSGASRCLSIHTEKKLLVAGTDEGYINLFSIEEDGLMYNKLLDKQEGVIVCLEWDASGEFIASGGMDSVRVWNVRTGHAMHRMLTGRSATNIPTTVTCLAVISSPKEMTVITGDTRGKLCMWNGKLGTLNCSYSSHLGAVRALAVSTDGNTVYCAGDTAIIATYEKVMMKQDTGGKWVKSIQRFIHEHPVYAMATYDKILFSAGVDSYLVASWCPPRTVVRFAPIGRGVGSCGTDAKGRPYVALRHGTVQLWRLGGDGAVHTLRWESPAGDALAHVLAPDVSWLAVSTSSNLCILSLNLQEEQPQVSKVKLGKGLKSGMAATVLAVSGDSKHLAVATRNGELVILEIVGEETLKARVQHLLRPHKTKDLIDTIHLLSMSADGDYVVAADLNSNIVVYHEGKLWCKLPRYDCALTAMDVNPKTLLLVLAYANQKIFEYDILNKGYSGFSKKLDSYHSKQLMQRCTPIKGIMFNSRNPNIIALYDDSVIFVINRKKEVPKDPSKIPRLDEEVVRKRHLEHPEEDNSNKTPQTKSSNKAFHYIKRQKHLVYLGSLNEGQVVSVEVDPMQITEKLPPSVRQNKFGQM